MAEAVQVIEELGGIEWKPDIYAQRRQLAAMDNRTRDMNFGSYRGNGPWMKYLIKEIGVGSILVICQELF